MAKVIRTPVDVNTPEQTGLAGNSFWTVLSATAGQIGTWAFYGASGGVTGGIIYGRIVVPSVIDANTQPRIIIDLFSHGANVTAGSLSVWRVGVFQVLTGEEYSQAFVHENAVNWTAPTTGGVKKSLSFTLTSAVTADSTLIVKIERDNDGTSGTDDSTATIYMPDCLLEFTATG